MRPGDPVQRGEDPADCPVSPAHCNSRALNVTHRQKETSESEGCLYSLAAGDRTIKTLERVPSRESSRKHLALLLGNSPFKLLRISTAKLVSR